MRLTKRFCNYGLLFALAAGCSGVVGKQGTGSGTGTPSGAAGQSGGAGNAGNAGNAGMTGGGAGIGGGNAGITGTTGIAGNSGAAACPSTAVAPTPLRRLTRFEYATSVRSLLGVDPAPANALPADEVTDGFNNNAGVLTVSDLHAEKYVLVSEQLAKAAVQQSLTTLTGCDAAARGESVCAADFARRFGRRAFRRPTTAADEQLLMAAYNAGRTGGSHAEGIEVMIRAALQSPHFLYRLETTTAPDPNSKLVPLGPYEMASRLSFLLWASGPDDALLDAAGRGELGSRTAVAERARAMLADPRARVAITDFYKQWFGTSRLEIMTKSGTLFPAYSDAVREGMRLETPAFVEHVLWSGDHKLATLLTSPVTFVTSALAPIYGVSAPANSSTTPRMVTLPANQGRSGILTQAGFLAVQAHPDQTSPTLRGKFIRSALMCQPPQMPPMDVDISVPEVTEGATARERFSAHQEAGSTCAGCHASMDPIGFAFEHFDAIGQHRLTENGKTIDVSGEMFFATDPNLNGPFVGVQELAQKLAVSPQVQDCLALQWFRYSAGRGESAEDGCSVRTLQQAFAVSGGDLTELVIAMTQTDAFWYRAPTQ